MPAKGSGDQVIQILLNGKIRDIPQNFKLGELLRQLQVNPRQIAVSVNWEVVIPSELEATSLREGDEVELFHAVGGG